MTAARARRAALVAAALLATLAPATAAGATPEAERRARAHFQAGEARFKAGAFDDALAEYQAGYEVLPLPGFLINVAQCQRRLGDLKTARATYQKFILVAPDSPLVPQVRSIITEIDGLLARPAGDDAGDGDAGRHTVPTTAAPTPAPLPETRAPLLAAPLPAAAPPPARRRWLLWGALGAVVVGGAVTAVALSAGGTTTVHDGSLATLRR